MADLDAPPPLGCSGRWRAGDWRERCALDLGHAGDCQNATGSVRWRTPPDPRQGELFAPTPLEDPT